ncbi:MAG: helix-turn-helix domain-containing protein [Natrialbaceae archaeon]
MKTRSARRDTDDVAQTADNDVVRGRIGVEIDPERHCDTLTDPVAAEVLWQDLRVRAGPTDYRGTEPFPGVRECHTELRHTDRNSPRYEYCVTEVREECLCPLLADSNCLARPERITGDTLIVAVTAKSGERFRSLVSEIHERARSVDIAQLRWSGKEAAGERTEGLTECQEEAVRTAIAVGYYESPRTATLEEVAERLGITKSATSQGLNAAERKLVESTFGT